MNLLTSLGLDWPHLCPVNDWTVDRGGKRYRRASSYKYVIDGSTGERYLDESSKHTHIKFALVTFGATFYHIVSLVVATAYRFFRVLFFHAFWKETDKKNDSFKARLIEWLSDGIRLFISPLGLPCLLITAIYGLVRGNQDARKLHAQMEIVFYGHPVAALCFHAQPFNSAYDNPMRRSQVLITNSIVISPLKMIGAIFFRIGCFLSFHALWKQQTWDGPSNFQERIIEWLKDGGGALVAPVGVIAAFFMGIYSLINNDSAEKLFKKVEKTFFGETLSLEIIPTKLREHTFGGSSDERDSY